MELTTSNSVKALDVMVETESTPGTKPSSSISICAESDRH